MAKAPERSTEQEPARSGKGKLIAIIAAAVVLAAMGAGAAVWLLKPDAAAQSHGETGGGHAAEEIEAPKAEALYLPLDPAFVVNLGEGRGQRFLQVQIELMARDQTQLDAASHHMPRIRSNLLLLLGQQDEQALSTRAGKEQLQSAVLDEINTVLRSETGHAGIEAVYFTRFVMQ